MLDKEVDKAHFVALEFWETVDDMVGDEIATPRLGREGDCLLKPGHGGGCGFCDAGFL